MSEKNKIILILGVVHFLVVVDFMVMIPMAPHLTEVFMLNPLEWSDMIMINTLAAAIFGIVAAFFFDRFDRKHVLFTLFIGFLVGLSVCAFADNHTLFLTGRALTGIFSANLLAACMAIMSDIVPEEKRATAMGTITIGIASGSAIGVPFFLKVSNVFSYREAFSGILILSALVAILSFRSIPSLKGHLNKPKSSPFSSMFAIFKSRNALLALLFVFIMITGHFLVYPFLGKCLVAINKLSKDDLVWITAIGGATSAISARYIGVVSDRLGKANAFRLLMGLSFIPVLIATHWTSQNITWIIVVMALFYTLNQGRLIPGHTMAISAIHAESRGAFMSLRSVMMNLGAAFASRIAGMVMVENPDGTYANYDIIGYISLAVCVIAMLLASKIKVGG